MITVVTLQLVVPLFFSYFVGKKGYIPLIVVSADAKSNPDICYSGFLLAQIYVKADHYFL